MKTPDALLLADPHIRSDKPRCRTEEDYLDTQDGKITFIFKLARKHQCPILIAGDLGNEAQWPNWLLRWFTFKVKKYGVKIYAIPGQHDLPYHRLRHWKKSAIGVLGTAKVINLIGIKGHFAPKEIKSFDLIPFPYGRPIVPIMKGASSLKSEPMVAMSHQMVIDRRLWPGQVAIKGHQLLRQFPEYKLILTGDNHTPFVFKYEDRILVNPGSVFRQEADEVNHRPRVYLWYSKSNTVKAVYIPIKKGVVSREHIDEKDERSERLTKYVDQMKLEYKVGTSYKKNLIKYFRKNEVDKKVKERVLEASE